MPGLYIHIPFCVKKCLYCDFVSFKADTEIDNYLFCLNREIMLTAESVKDIVYNTIFIGGGTPSLLSAEQLTRLMQCVYDSFKIAPECETTIESNPGTLTNAKLSAYRAAKINRLSIGLQSASDELLRRIGRIHDFEQFKCSFEAARRSGFNNINVDIMYGLPGQSVESYLDTIDELKHFEPEHISSYSLILEAATPLKQKLSSGEENLPDDDDVFDMHTAGIERLTKYGYKRYEISNYSKSNKQCKHNINYWENGEYIGIGLSAHSAQRIQNNWTRWENTASLSKYSDMLHVEILPRKTTSIIPKPEEMFETIMMGLRMIKGLDISAFDSRFNVDFCTLYNAGISRNTELGFLIIDNGRAYLTEKGLDMQNRVLLDFLDDK